MRFIILVSALILSGVLAPGHAYSQTLKKSTLTGEIFSASATVTVGSSGSVLLVPENRFYVLTQACLQDPFGTATLTGSDLGVIVTLDGCTNYSPGIVFQPGEEIIYIVGTPPFPLPTAGSTVIVTGVLLDPNSEDD